MQFLQNAEIFMLSGSEYYYSAIAGFCAGLHMISFAFYDLLFSAAVAAASAFSMLRAWSRMDIFDIEMVAFRL